MTQSNPADRPRSARILIILLAMLLTMALPVFLVRAMAPGSKGCDFPEFWAAGRHVLQHGTRQNDSLLYRYLPSVDVAWAVFGWMPLWVAAPIYYLFSCMTWVALLRAVRSYLLPETSTRHLHSAVLISALVTIVFTLDHLMLGAFHILMLWLLIAGVARSLGGRQWSGAAMVGLAIWIKLLPLIAVPYLILKRRWGTAVLSLAFAFAINVSLSLIGYGATGAWSTHVEWWRGHAIGDLHALLTNPQPVPDQRDRNQSLAAVMRRTFTHLGATEQKVGNPNNHWMPSPVADLSANQLRLSYFGLVAMLCAGLGWWWRKPAASLDQSRLGAEIAVLALATMWFSPIVFSYHPTAILPALAVVIAAPKNHAWYKRLTIGIAIAGACLLAFPAARSIGEALWASGWVAIATMLSHYRPPHDTASATLIISETCKKSG